MENSMVPPGIETFQKAIEADEAGEYEKAVTLYRAAALRSTTGLMYKDRSTKKIIQERIQGYMDRADDLAMYIKRQNELDKKGGGGGSASNKKGASTVDTPVAPIRSVVEYAMEKTSAESIVSSEIERISFGDESGDDEENDDDSFSPIASTGAKSKLILPDLVLLSTTSKCTISADTLGQNGAPDVLLDDTVKDAKVDQWVVNGKDLAKIAQYESHWIQLDWTVPVLVSRVVLDWGGAYSLNYELQIRSSPYQAWETVVKIPDPNMVQRHWGESEGAGSDHPHHRLHEIDVPFSKLVTSMRLFIHESAFKNGYFYLWQIQAFGYESSVRDDGVATQPFLFAEAPVLLTDLSDFVTVEASDAGESGLCIANVLTSGTDLDKDRWFVAPESIFGGLWIRANFQSSVLLTKVVLDWSGECPLEYELQVGSQDDWTTLRRFPDIHNVKVEEFGRLPHTTNTVLHQIHTFKMPVTTTATRSLHVLILKPATKWGIALWQMRLYGYVVKEQ